MTLAVSPAVYVTNNGDMSQATLTCGPVDMRTTGRGFAFQAVYTGAPVGTLQLQVALNQPSLAGQGSNPGAGGTWGNSTFTNYGSAVSVNGAGSYLWDVIGTNVSAAQVVYTKTSGTGTLVVNCNVKSE